MTTNIDTQAHGGGVEAAWAEWKKRWGDGTPPTYVYEAFMHGYRAALAASPAASPAAPAPAPAAGVNAMPKGER